MASSSNWAGLRSLGSVLKRLLAALAMGLMGAVVCGFTAGILTICAYGIGMIVGVAAGFGAGVIASRRLPAKDIAIAFVGSATAFAVTQWVGNYLEKDSFGVALTALTIYSVVAFALLWSVPRIFAPTFRYWLAVVMSVLFVIATFAAYTVSVYRI